MGSQTAAQALKVGSPADPLVEFETPNGTCTVLIDTVKGYMEIFTEHEPDPRDWEIVCGLIRQVVETRDIGQPDYLSGVLVWKVSLRPQVLPQPPDLLAC